MIMRGRAWLHRPYSAATWQEATVRADLTVRIGAPSDFVASVLPSILARFRGQHPDVRFAIRSDFYEPLLRQLLGGVA